MVAIIDALDDNHAITLLTTVAKGRGLLNNDLIQATSEVQDALVQAFGEPILSLPFSPGELARQSLRLLSQDPEAAQAIEALAQGPPLQRFAFLETVGVVTLALAVLTTRVRYEKNKSGKISFLIEKKALDNVVLKKLVELLQRSILGQSE